LRSNQLAQQEEKYRTKSGECYLAAHNARTPFEKQAWLELGRDWDKLADEVRDLLDAPPIVQLDFRAVARGGYTLGNGQG
jgi:hypothetical protein